MFKNKTITELQSISLLKSSIFKKQDIEKINKIGLKDCFFGNNLFFQFLESLKSKNPIIVTDKNIATKYKDILQNYDLIILPQESSRLMATIKIVDYLIDLLIKKKVKSQIYPIAFGCGTICDIVKLSCKRLNINFSIIASSLSMNGFASKTSSIVTNDIKHSFDSKLPEYIVFDEVILLEAPQELKLAGFYDSLATITANFDILLSNIYTDTHIDNTLIEDCFSLIIKISKNIFINNRDLALLLLIGGIGMSLNNSSFTASGGEHILSHVIEMENNDLTFCNLYHGLQIGLLLKFCLKNQIEISKNLLNFIDIKISRIKKEDIRNFFNYNDDKINQIIKSKEIKEGWEDRIKGNISKIANATKQLKELDFLLIKLDVEQKMYKFQITDKYLYTISKKAKCFRDRFTFIDLIS
jgi:glycerol dehydrogenase-like iron-containing ADH family enzyme